MIIKAFLGISKGIRVYCILDNSSKQVDLEYLSLDTKKEILEKKKEVDGNPMAKWTQIESPRITISKDEYDRLISFQYGIMGKRSVDNETYLGYLLQSFNKDQLKDICRQYKIKNYSTLKKQDLIEHIIISLSEDEQNDILYTLEFAIINREVAKALLILNQRGDEKITEIKENLAHNEIELTFKGMDWETTSFLQITEENIGDPERDCDCLVGTNQGFCPHFWVAFIELLKKKVFSLKSWKLTDIPSVIKTIGGDT